MCCGGARNMRFIVEECLKWVNQRKAFGKPLHSQAVIRAKLADMISKTEAAQHWLENITYQMQHMDYKQQAQLLAGYVRDSVGSSATSGALITLRYTDR